MMRTSLEYHELTDEAQDARSRRADVLNAVRQELRAVSLAGERRIKNEMPVDTGRARAGWGHHTPGDTSNPDSSPGDAVWQENDNGLSITQGTNVEYTQYLNDGHSKQAPAGFIDAAEEHMQRVLDDEIDQLMRLW